MRFEVGARVGASGTSVSTVARPSLSTACVRSACRFGMSDAAEEGEPPADATAAVEPEPEPPAFRMHDGEDHGAV